MDTPASLRTFDTGSKHFWKRVIHNDSNLALVIDVKKSIPSYKLSISKFAVVDDDSVLFAFSHAVLRRLIERLFSDISTLCFLLNSVMKCCINKLSKSSPPKCVSPAVDLTSNIPSSIHISEISWVPPPQSTIRTYCSFGLLSRPYAIDAAVGSLIIRNTFNPAICPASFVACLCESLKYAGQVITASVTFSPR